MLETEIEELKKNIQYITENESSYFLKEQIEYNLLKLNEQVHSRTNSLKHLQSVKRTLLDKLEHCIEEVFLKVKVKNFTLSGLNDLTLKTWNNLIENIDLITSLVSMLKNVEYISMHVNNDQILLQVPELSAQEIEGIGDKTKEFLKKRVLLTYEKKGKYNLLVLTFEKKESGFLKVNFNGKNYFFLNSVFYHFMCSKEELKNISYPRLILKVNDKLELEKFDEDIRLCNNISTLYIPFMNNEICIAFEDCKLELTENELVTKDFNTNFLSKYSYIPSKYLLIDILELFK